MKSQKLLVLAISLSICPTMAYAYVDPGTGAYLLQMLIAIFGAVVFYISRPRQLFQLIRNLFKKKNKN